MPRKKIVPTIQTRSPGLFGLRRVPPLVLKALLLVVIVLTVGVALIPTSALAQTIDISKLGAEERQKILDITTGKAADPVVSPPVPDQSKYIKAAEEWANLGKNVGTGLVAAARELGVAVEEFAKTDVGKITTAIIIWKILGEDAKELAKAFYEIIAGIAAVILGLLMAFKGYRYYTYQEPEITYTQVPVLFGLWSRSKRATYKRKRMDTEAWYRVPGDVVAINFIFGAFGVILTIVGIIHVM